MSTNFAVNKGELLVVWRGEYSDRAVAAMFRANTDFHFQECLYRFAEENGYTMLSGDVRAQEKSTEDPEHEFLAWLSANDYVDDEDYREVEFLSDYELMGIR